MAAPQTDLKPYAWSLPVTIEFGPGVAEQAAETLLGRRVVVLAFEQAMQHAPVARIGRAVSDALLDWIEVPNGLSTLALGRSLADRVWPALSRHPDSVLVGLGGGSVMDVAKWLRQRPMSMNTQDLEQLLTSSVPPLGWKRHALWLMPTTAGTGSEVTRWSTLWDTETRPAFKRSFDQAYAYADRAIVDPLLSVSCPQTVTLHSALDAFGHCLEVLWNRHRNPISVALAIDAARHIIQALPAVLSDPINPRHRSRLSHASLQAGVAFSQTRTALAHALSYRLTLEQGVDHGAAVAVWLPLTWRMAAGCSAEVDAALQKIWDVEPSRGEHKMLDWFRKIGFSVSLQSLGIADSAQRVQAALAHERGRNFVGRWPDGEG